MSRMEKAFTLFDAYNKQDPNLITRGDKIYPAEYFYALELYNWIKKLAPQASEALLLASRSQHIGRWQFPRSEYPAGKAGYYKWRTELAKRHAEIAGRLLAEAGYDQHEIEEVQHILLKQHIKTDEEVQLMEDALCLVFLEFQYEDFLLRYDDIKMVGILRKSWAKMSPKGREAALALNFSKRGKDLIQQALGK